MSPPIPVAALIPTWNGWEDTRRCLESLAACEPALSRVLVTDNASRDGTPGLLAETFPDAEVLVLERNLGFSRAVNRGLERLLSDQGLEGILLLNNDVVVAPSAPGILLDVLRREPRAAGVCPLIPYVQPPDRVWYAGGRIALWRGHVAHRYLRRKVRGVPVGRTDTDYLTGAAVLLRPDALRRVGMLSEAFGFYAEDADWSLRARAAGWRLLLEPRARVAHRVSASIGGPFSRRKILARMRALGLLFRRHARPWHWVSVLPAGLLITLPQSLFLLLRGRRRGR